MLRFILTRQTDAQRADIISGYVYESIPGRDLNQ